MVKVSITLPNNAHITFESEEAEVIHEVVSMVLRDLPRDLMGSAPVKNGHGGHYPDTEKGNGVPQAVVSSPPTIPPVPATELPTQAGHSAESPATNPVVAAPPAPTPEPPRQVTAAPLAAPDTRPADPAADRTFLEFCQSVNPVGDMRRVVVAAEGAARYLGRASVDADELGRLFDLAGWPRPHSFVQTLRNAGRSKFRWLERIPGRSGHYRVTEVGRATALGQ